MGFLDGFIVRFPCLLREGWGQESVDDGVDQYGVRHCLFFSSNQLLSLLGHISEPRNFYTNVGARLIVPLGLYHIHRYRYCLIGMFSPSVCCPFPYLVGGRLFPSVILFLGQGGIQHPETNEAYYVAVNFSTDGFHGSCGKKGVV